MTLQDMSDNSSSVNGSDMSSGEFDSDAESRVSSVLTEVAFLYEISGFLKFKAFVFFFKIRIAS